MLWRPFRVQACLLTLMHGENEDSKKAIKEIMKAIIMRQSMRLEE